MAVSQAVPQEPCTAQYLNSLNTDSRTPAKSDVVVVGGGIHSLIYAIHAQKKFLASAVAASSATAPSITVLEKSESPSYKIGESTLTVFGLWLKTIGVGSALLWRLFGPKDGLAFYYLDHSNPNECGTFSANGPPGDFVPTLQIERKISELLLTLYAQRLGVRVLHGHNVDVDATVLPKEHCHSQVEMKVSTGHDDATTIRTNLLVDATGRFRRFASKASRKQILPGFNTDAFWAYFECPGDESEIPLPSYESCNTNHICLPEGWAWVIRLPSWEESPVENLAAMINFLLDLNAQDVHPDEYPSSMELAKRFGLKFRWVVSIGYALRDDVVYPSDMSSYGSCEAERKFNWITGRYALMKGLMDKHRLVQDLYGPKSTWFIRKGLTYQSPTVAGPRWAAIGDAAGFTNPLYSPGINCNMATSIYLAEATQKYLSGTKPDQAKQMMAAYNRFCAGRVPNLHRMNRFNYLLMRSPKTGPLGPLWQYLCGTGNEHWRKMRTYTLADVAEVLTSWEWGANRPEFIAFADRAIAIMDGPPSRAEPEAVAALLELSARMVAEALASDKYEGRWAGLLRWYDDDLVRCPEKTERDVLARRCEACRNWRILRGDCCRCPTCGAANTRNEIVKLDDSGKDGR
ncbi:Uu.00g032130.m01.CDS01 [Anthostomella pinea]|uniref:Uu.00g032130.m01.CDS01 n=1 Tax=Anthostomella pinea TaxID=933095 RepID=A0AAI8V8M5_9PEZI|nr:Uu.00g032130.m01.CDS01 [Anthostomella pinea]